MTVKYFPGGWTQKDSRVNETMIWKNNILFKLPEDINIEYNTKSKIIKIQPPS